MSSMAGRALRIYFNDGGGELALEGETSSNFTITRDGIDVTDKGDGPVRTYIDDAVGSWAMEGGFEGVVKSARLLQLANSTSQFTAPFRIMIGTLGEYTGLFGITSIAVSGAEGAEAVTFTGSIVSSGAITYT